MNFYVDQWERNGYETKEDVKIGDVIKLNPLGESFWVVVKTIEEGNVYTGSVNNHLVRDSEYTFGDFVCFSSLDIRDHKNQTVQTLQRVILIQHIARLIRRREQEIGRQLTVKDVDHLFTRFSVTQ